MPCRVLIVDDNQRFLDAARALLVREGMGIVATATRSTEALDLADELRPDVVLVDVVLADESGFDLARRFADRDPEGPAVILVSTHAEEDFAELVEESSAIGFLPKAELSAGVIQRLLDLSWAAGYRASR
jgi:DNA-binding NarL/FixJ family response regulator